MAVGNFKVKYVGIFNLEELINSISGWMSSRAYSVKETKFKHKPPKMEAAWSGSRKVNTYVKEKLEVSFYAENLQKVEVLKGKERKLMDKARLIIVITADLETGYADYLDRQHWSQNTFLIKLKDFFNKWVLNKDLKLIYEDEVYYDGLHLSNFIKTKLNMTLDQGEF